MHARLMVRLLVLVSVLSMSMLISMVRIPRMFQAEEGFVVVAELIHHRKPSKAS
jgi:hypothetical protein